MDHNPDLRASDADREQAFQTLRAEVASGRITLDEFSDRVAHAYRARTVGDLQALTRDLPTPAPQPTSPAPASAITLPVVVIAAIALLVVLGVAVLLWMTVMMQHMGPMMGR
ncbi:MULTISPECIES: DUF1707 SHOCT-like domain-containing protein [Nocardia]|uniref:DUF1707 SHOCT-like domain-containing protein n=2 Tax=Nocardiaceae TaxID=85025 RepID=UPI000AA1F0C0|nr:DUF1707 domain-containing protein [Nocardia arizonensis]